MKAIWSIFEALLSALLPAAGRHRAGARHARRVPVGATTAEPVVRPARVTGPGPRARGEDIGVVRPYFVAFEREQRGRTRRQRLWLAPQGVGIDIGIGVRVVHGLTGAA